MDETTAALINIADGIYETTLGSEVVHEAIRRLIDTFACALGALGAPPANIARTLAGGVTGTPSATALGLSSPTSMEMAAFTNSILVRYLDLNDMYFAPAGGGAHPSDVIPASLAVGEALAVRGSDLLTAIVTSYEIQGRLAGAVRIRELGWDQGLFAVLASALAAGKLLRLDADTLSHAISLAITPHIPTRRSRAGALSMWKGCATANAVRNGIFAALLAANGMTGPPAPFEGADGIWQRVTGPFSVEPLSHTAPLVLTQVHTKVRPAEYNAQGPIELILALRKDAALKAIERIDVYSYWLTVSEIGSEPEKWEPTTRETADHSLPYLLATALKNGRIGPEDFTLSRILEPRLRPLMRRIFIHEDREYTRRFPDELCNRIVVRLRDGRELYAECNQPPGHASRPLSDEAIDQKFGNAIDAAGPSNAEHLESLRSALWTLSECPNIATVMEPLRNLRSV